MNRVVVTTSAEQTKDLAKEVLKDLKGSRVIALTGQLGSGKTTFSQGIGQALGVNRMVSPTYVLLREYKIKSRGAEINSLYHADLYRLTTKVEALELGLSEIWADTKNLLLIEWPEKVIELLPKDALQINFEKNNDQRIITISTI